MSDLLTSWQERAVRLTRSVRARWAAVALLCVAAGTVGSLLGARSIARTDADEARSTFRLTSTAIAASLESAIQRQDALGVAASTFFAAQPQATRSEFERWARWAGATKRDPGLDRLALVALLPLPPATAGTAPQRSAGAQTRTGQTAAASSDRIAAASTGQVAATSTGQATAASAAGATVASAGQPSAAPSGGGRAAGSSARPSPAARPGARILAIGARSYLCFTVGELPPSNQGSGGPRHDCALTPTLIETRTAGRSRYRSASLEGQPALTLDTPVYRGNALPLSSVGRRAAFVGWLREVLSPQKLLQRTLVGHPAEALRLRYRPGPSTLVFASGSPQSGAQSSVVSLRGGWSARILGPVVDAGVLSGGDSLALLVVGIVASLLAGALAFLLGSRWRTEGEPVRPAAAVDSSEELYDQLTGLPNRALTLDRAAYMLARAGRQSGMLSGALIVDVDWFKDINDKLGREAGDQLLRVVAQRLQHAVRADDTVGRLDHDKFVALVESQARGVKLESLAARMIEALHEPVEIEGFGPSFHMTASIGVAFGRYASTENLLADAQVALDAAKSAGKDRFTLFNANLRSVIEDRGVLDSELNAALQDKQFFLLYQPICDLSTRQVTGMEALIRWRHPERGVVLSADFMPAAEETALSVPIGRWALEEACNRAAEWNASGRQAAIAVKVSPAQLNRDGFVSDVRRALQQSGIDPSALTLEIPEAAVIGDVELAAVRLREVKQLGVRIAIEEFGGGYAHRSDLQCLPLDFLKVDRSSVAASDDEDYRSWLLEAIVLFARDLSLGVVATGVETHEQLADLQRIGCTMVQGPLIGEPVPVEGVEEALGRTLAPQTSASAAPIAASPATSQAT